MTTTQIQQDAIELQKQIYANDYFVRLYEAALHQDKMTPAGIDNAEHDDRKIVDMANKMWFALPDSMSIRRPPFFLLCNIAEHCFDDGPEDE